MRHKRAVHAPARVARVTALGCVSQLSNLSSTVPVGASLREVERARWETKVRGNSEQRPLTQTRTPQWTPADTQPHAVWREAAAQLQTEDSANSDFVMALYFMKPGGRTSQADSSTAGAAALVVPFAPDSEDPSSPDGLASSDSVVALDFAVPGRRASPPPRDFATVVSLILSVLLRSIILTTCDSAHKDERLLENERPVQTGSLTSQMVATARQGSRQVLKRCQQAAQHNGTSAHVEKSTLRTSNTMQ